jgi:tRNA (cmo5U34)-methyltransferase
MKRDQVFVGTTLRAGDFEFNAQVAEVFDDMVARSIPFYHEQQRMIVDIGNRFWLPETDIYDLGFSTATTLINLCKTIEGSAHFIGYDNSLPMHKEAQRKITELGFQNRIEVRYADLNDDLSTLSLTNASVVTMCWTLQFIRPMQRDAVIRWIYDGLVNGGVLVVTDKILTSDPRLNRFFVDFYYQLKTRNGYSWEEIQRKREALENVMIPYRIDENLALFRRNGFEISEPFFQWYNFAGFLCMKKSQ